MNSLLLWNFVVPALAGVMGLVAHYWSWRNHYYGDMAQMVSAKVKQRVILPLFIAMPTYLLLLTGWWSVRDMLAPYMATEQVPIPWGVRLVLVVFVSAVVALCIYSGAEALCQKYGMKLPHEFYKSSFGHNYRLGDNYQFPPSAL